MSDDEISMWLDLMAEAPDLEWAYYDVVDSQPRVLSEMARRGGEAYPRLGRNLNSTITVTGLLARAYVREQLAARGRIWEEVTHDRP